MASLLVRALFFFLLFNMAVAHYYWFEMPGALKFGDGSDIPMDDEPLQMRKRFRIKYVRDLARLNPNGL